MNTTTGHTTGPEFGELIIVFILIMLVIYIYMAIALMKIADRTGTPNGWFAFIPFLNIYLLTQIGGVSGLWTLSIFLIIIPYLGIPVIIVVFAFFFWKVAEARNRPGWWGIIIAIVPIVNLAMIFILAWEGGNNTTKPEKSKRFSKLSIFSVILSSLVFLFFFYGLSFIYTNIGGFTLLSLPLHFLIPLIPLSLCLISLHRDLKRNDTKGKYFSIIGVILVTITYVILVLGLFWELIKLITGLSIP
ncbi:MAG: hypothetical protein ACOCRK_03805 [bacterium]